MQNRRREWFAGQLDLDPTKLQFSLDETGASTNLARKSGRCRRGRSVMGCHPAQSLQNGTLIVRPPPSLALTAARTFDGPINAALGSRIGWRHASCPHPRPARSSSWTISPLAGAGPRVEQLIKAVGMQLRYLPAYSPDMNPIEKAFSKLKAFLRKIAERTVAGLAARPRNLRRHLQALGMYKLLQILRILDDKQDDRIPL